ncbi:MAG: S1 RNA-binding domain-containing protein, partial [Candidatus Gracilibacteria bacterium]|nr:S1 RNA-binding domain-containing protein [Candidatus Gracilibacteria bacterium]
HRIIKEYLNGRLDEKRMKHYKTILKNIADRTSATEIIAEDIERKVRYLKVIDFMSDKIGEKFSSIVSGVTENGFFVELESGVEGFVHKNSLKKLFVSDLDGYCFFIGKEKFLIGKEVETELIGTDRRSKKIDFSIFS